jgi:hypothetical protein
LYPCFPDPISKQKREENCCCCCCYCCYCKYIPSICPPQPPLVTCPSPTLPNEPPICEQRRAAFQATNPQLRFDFNLMYYFFNNQVTFAEAIQQCNATFGFTLITLQELIAISNDFNTAGLCQMLLWTTHNGVPTLAYFVPGSRTPIIPVPTASLSCLAYSIYRYRP